MAAKKKAAKKRATSKKAKAVKLSLTNLNTRLSGVEDFLAKTFPG